VCGDVIVGLICRVGLEALYLIKMMTKDYAVVHRMKRLAVLYNPC
jgi:hypothetical protein